MQIKRTTINNIVILVVGFIILTGIGLVLSNKSTSTDNANVVSISGDKQIIDLTAKGGYSPNLITAEANKDTVLRVNTNNTFDCSSALTIPQLGIQKNLPVSGQTEISLGVQESGAEINGTCTMGMYSFKIKFI